MKPRIRFNSIINKYECKYPGRWIGFGDTPESAHEHYRWMNSGTEKYNLGM